MLDVWWQSAYLRMCCLATRECTVLVAARDVDVAVCVESDHRVEEDHGVGSFFDREADLLRPHALHRRRNAGRADLKAPPDAIVHVEFEPK